MYEEDINIETTFVMIKPDAVGRGLVGEILTRFENKFLRIVRMEMRWKNLDWLKLMYGHVEEGIFQGLEEFMLDAPLIGVVLIGPEAISVVRRMVGATDSQEADVGTIRGDYGTSPCRYNICHASDSELATEEEITWFFDPKTDEYQ